MLAECVKDWSRAWKQEGREAGQKKGEVTMPVRVLELRFGPLDETTRAKLDGADADTLRRWGERVLTASTLAGTAIQDFRWSPQNSGWPQTRLDAGIGGSLPD
jgi:hypothetical protein